MVYDLEGVCVAYL